MIENGFDTGVGVNGLKLQAINKKISE